MPKASEPHRQKMSYVPFLDAESELYNLHLSEIRFWPTAGEILSFLDHGRQNLFASFVSIVRVRAAEK